MQPVQKTKGLDIPISGIPEQVVGEGSPVSRAALPEDNWQGATVFIHMVLYGQSLRDHPELEDIHYSICRPPMMIKAVLGILDELGVDPENIHFDDFGE